MAIGGSGPNDAPPPPLLPPAAVRPAIVLLGCAAQSSAHVVHLLGFDLLGCSKVGDISPPPLAVRKCNAQAAAAWAANSSAMRTPAADGAGLLEPRQGASTTRLGF